MSFEKFSKFYKTILQEAREEALKIVSEMLSTDDVPDLYKAYHLKLLLPYLSYLCTDKDKEMLRNCGLSNLTFKQFISYETICESLNKLFESSNYNINYPIVFKCYENYFSDYFMSILNLEPKLDFDLTKITSNMSRQIRNGTFENGLSDEVKSDLNANKNLIKEILPLFGYSFKDNEMAPNLKRSIKFPHKLWVPNLYNSLLKDNENINISDFKVFFYDLMEIIIRDKSILKNDIDSISNYATIRRFKIKRVERLILS